MTKPSNTPDSDRFVSGALGPEGPELTCDQCFELLDRYADLEVAGRDGEAAVPGMRAHLAGCPACAEDYSSLLTLISKAQ